VDEDNRRSVSKLSKKKKVAGQRSTMWFFIPLQKGMESVFVARAYPRTAPYSRKGLGNLFKCVYSHPHGGAI
jgi:hypothetical protein